MRDSGYPLITTDPFKKNHHPLPLAGEAAVPVSLVGNDATIDEE